MTRRHQQNTRRHLAARKRAHGLSLLEIVIALGLGLVLLAGATNLFLGSSQTFRTNESLSRMQEDTRFAMNRLGREGRMAGYRGCIPGERILNSLDQSDEAYSEALYDGGRLMGWATNSMDDDTLTLGDLSHGSSGDWFTGTGTDDGILTQLVGQGVVGSSDILVLNRAAAEDGVTSAAPDSGNENTLHLDGDVNVPLGQIVLMVGSDCSQGELFQQTNNSGGKTLTKGIGASVNPGNASNDPFSFTVDDNTRFYSQRSTAYFVRLNDDGVPGLFEQRVEGEGGSAQELIRGVESLLVRYGLAESADATVATAYVPANEVDDWDRVVSIRVALLIRSSELLSNPLNTQTYNLMGVHVRPNEDSASGPGEDHRIRMVATRTIGLRNRLQ